VETAIVLLWITVIIEAVLIFYLSKFVSTFLKKLRINNQSELIPDKLKIGEKVPLFREEDQVGRLISLAENSMNNNTLIIFSSSQCVYCHEVLSNISLISSNFKTLRIIVVGKDELEIKITDDVHYIKSKVIFDNYLVHVTPTILLLDNRNHLINYLDVQHSHGLNIVLKNYLIPTLSVS